MERGKPGAENDVGGNVTLRSGSKVNARVYAEWLGRQGQRVVRTGSSYWQRIAPGVYQAFPYHWLIAPGERELEELFFRHRAVAVRYSLAADAAQGLASYHVVRQGGAYGLESLGYRTRKNVRLGLRRCAVERIAFSRLAEEGWRLRSETLERQGREMRVSPESWRKRFLLAGELEGFEAWGALVAGRLAAYLVAFHMDDCCYLLYQQSGREFLRECVNNALTFVATETLAARPGVRLLFYGMHSLDASASMNEFKFHMGYQAKAVRQRVVFHPLIRPFINRASYRVLQQVARWRPKSRALSKAEGMLRFYLEGQARPTEHAEALG